MQQLLFLVNYEAKHDVNILSPKNRIISKLDYAPLVTLEACPVITVYGEDHFAMPANGVVVDIPARFIRNPVTNRAPNRTMYSLDDVKLCRPLMPLFMRNCLPLMVREQTLALLQHFDPLESQTPGLSKRQQEACPEVYLPCCIRGHLL